MQVRIVMELTGDHGGEIGREIIADLRKVTTGAEDLGLSLAEGKALLARLQQKMVETQVELWLKENHQADDRRMRHKGYYPVTFHTLFGDVRLIPDGRIVIGLDGGYIRDRDDRKKNFELIVGRSLPEDGEPRYIGFVHGYDRKPQRRILDHLKKQGVQANQDITFITDGGEEVRSLAEMIAPASEHVLDWFHITMRITVLRQFAQGLRHHDKETGNGMLDTLCRIKWYLWHGNTCRAHEEIDWLLDDAEATEADYPNMRKFLTAIGEFRSYIGSNHVSLINYGERYRSGERISSAFVEATVNAVISKRFAKKQQMQWSRTGAHLLLQTRTQTLDGSLRTTFETWYPGMANDNHPKVDRRIAGYSSPAGFSRAFHKATGLGPRAFRKKIRIDAGT